MACIFFYSFCFRWLHLDEDIPTFELFRTINSFWDVTSYIEPSYPDNLSSPVKTEKQQSNSKIEQIDSIKQSSPPHSPPIEQLSPHFPEMDDNQQVPTPENAEEENEQEYDLQLPLTQM